MLVIISDLHLKDGTSGSSITPDAFRVFSERLRSMAYHASWRADGRYEPLRSIDLLLLGDAFDLIRSERWLVDANDEVETIRPWDHPQGHAYSEKIAEITDAILEHNQIGFELLKRISRGEMVQLPPATQAGQPDHNSAERIPLIVRIHYMVGNHDWFFHLPGSAYDAVRQRVVDTSGLSNSIEPFPYHPEESPTIMKLFRDYRVYARHGDLFDKMNYDADAGRDASTVGDAMTIDLLTRFPYEVRRQTGTRLPLELSEGLKELSNIRPAIVTPLWVNNLVNNYASDPEQSKFIKNIWDTAAEEFLQTGFVRSHDRWLAFDPVDGLEAALFLAKGLSFDAISKLAGWANQKLWGADKISIAENALKETAYKDRTADYIIYGHTHFHEIAPLDTYFDNSVMHNQIYINSGTWHSYYDMTMQAPAKLKFVGMHVMTYLAFFKDDERGGKHFEAWSGSLSQ